MENKKASIIIPVLNEEENLEILYTTIKDVMDKTGYEYEIIFIDDGSTDSSGEILNSFSNNPKVKIITFRKNYGQTAAIAAGFEKSSGDYIVSLDADLQNDPNDIPKLLKKIEEGFDTVSGWRKDRKDPFFTRSLPSKIANFLIKLISGVKLHDFGCSLKAYRKNIVKDINLYGEMHRFIPIFVFWVGGKITEVPVNHKPRIYGKSKYGLKRTLKVIIDLVTIKFLTSFSTKPNYIFGGMGIILIVLGFIAFFITSYRVLILGRVEATPLVFIMTILFITGIQFILMGLIAEIVIRTHYESQKKQIYYIKSLKNF